MTTKMQKIRICRKRCPEYYTTPKEVGGKYLISKCRQDKIKLDIGTKCRHGFFELPPSNSATIERDSYD